MRVRRDVPMALRVAVAYLLLGSLWILGTDWLVQVLASGPAQQRYWQTYKGAAFVLFSAGAIYWLVHREWTGRRRSERMFAQLLDLTPDPSVVYRRRDQEVLRANAPFSELVGLTRDELRGRRVGDLAIRYRSDEEEELQRRLRQEGRLENFHLHITTLDGRDRALLLSSRTVPLDGEEVILSVGKDITALEETEGHLERQLDRLEALREIDLAISGSLEVEVTLRVILDQVVSRLEVDAAAVLLLHPYTESLECRARRGFRTSALAGVTLSLEEGYAGRVARTGKRVVVRDLRRPEEETGRALARSVAPEGFVAYMGIPLVAKGRVNGVLELFQRGSLSPDEDWLGFLDAVAGQAAIAIDSANLLTELQEANRDLRRAYDETIVGWARALDLRDHETHGHTRRVTDLTLRLAREFGVRDRDLVHVRRGALLHDIGKMAVPDAILLKPGPLNEHEWEVMKRHPEFAHRLLSPIGYLRESLDIPYCHHEKWDGTGYPRGLRGDEIPLAARIFCVVDVWDALRSERPYRGAWDAERTREHLVSQKERHFQPELVDAFLGLDAEALRHRDYEGAFQGSLSLGTSA